MKSWKLVLAVIFASALTVQYAFASTITVQYVGSANFGAGAVGYGTGTVWPNPTYPGSPEHQVAVGIGGDNFSTSDKSYPFSSTGSFNTWCVDITHWLTGGQVTYTIGGAAELNGIFGSDRVSGLQRLANEVYSTVDNREESAAFQLATWAIMFGEKIGGVYSLSGSTFRAPSTDTGYNLAFGWLSALDGAVATGNYSMTYLYEPMVTGAVKRTQDMVVFTPAPVPEPATLLLLGFGLAGLAGVRRKFRK